MNTRISSLQFAAAAYRAAAEYKTIYVRSCPGAPMSAANKYKFINGNTFNARPERRAAIEAADEDAFGFDCSGLVKGLLWGWCGDLSATYGGAVYKGNDVPDISADALISVSRDVSTDFSAIELGEVVWKSGHIGIYVGGGLSVECTYRWNDGVQITACSNTRKGFNTRVWTKHGRLPYVTYTGTTEDVSTAEFGGFGPEPQTAPHVFGLSSPRQTGELVTCLQSLLSYSGYTDDEDKPVEIDGTLGPRTWQAFGKFLAAHVQTEPDRELKRAEIFIDGELVSSFWMKGEEVSGIG